MHLIRILYAEDDRLVLDAVRETLEAEGWSVEACADGTEALARLEGRERFDALLPDCDLPGLSGVELVRRARLLPRRAGTPVVVFSAGEWRAEALSGGADALLRKPHDIGRLMGTLARLISAAPRQGG